MKAAAQLPANPATGPSTLNPFQLTVVAGNSGRTEFNVLLSMLSTLLANEGQSLPASGSQTAPVVDATGNSSTEQPAGSGSASSQVAAIEQQLIEMLDSGSPVTKKNPAGKGQNKASETYTAAWLPLISPFQISSEPQGQSAQTSGDQSSSPEIPQNVLSILDQEIYALMNGAQPTSPDGPTQAVNTTDVRTSNPQNGADPAPAQQSLRSAASMTANADMLKLLSSALVGSAGEDVAKEVLSNLGATPANSASGSDLVQKLKNGATVAVTRQATAASVAVDPSVVAASGQKASPSIIQDLNGAAVSNVKASVQNAAADAVSISIPASAVNTSSTVAIPQADPGSQAGNSTGSTTAQPAGRTDAVLTNQNSQVSPVQSNQDKRNTTDSDEGLADMLKQGSAQSLVNASDTGKVGTSFRQALSAATGNSTTSTAKPDAAQIAQSIVKEVNLMTQDGKTVVNMKLEPEDLGTVVLKVASQGGKISAEFNVKTPDARMFLETSIPQMKQALQTNGVSVAHLSVNLSAGDSSNRRPQYQAKKQQQKYYASLPAEQIEAARNFGYNTMELKV